MLQKQGTKVDKVLNFAIDDSILEERITGRWIHPSSGRTYHTKFAPPKVPSVDDVGVFFFFVKKILLIHLFNYKMFIDIKRIFKLYYFRYQD